MLLERENQAESIKLDSTAVERRIPMRNTMKKIVSFLKQEDGPTAVEYAVMLALIVVVCIAAITTLGSNANSTFGIIGDAVKPTAS
jgi:pilus assembly protein Flp/PilA